ncbi:MAG: DinB family protein, partial [Candidatus Limnocylindrales bacterium]
MATKGLTVDEIMAILRETPGRITGLTDGVAEAQLHTPPEPDAWSVNDVLAHLRACHDVLGGNMLRIIREDHPAWKGMSPRTWQRRSDYGEWQFRPAFEAFRAQRAELLEVLEPLPPDAWDRTATVSVPPAKVYEYTTRYYGDW